MLNAGRCAVKGSVMLHRIVIAPIWRLGVTVSLMLACGTGGAAAQDIDVWIAAFIPAQHPGNPGYVRAVPGASGTYIPHPALPFCYETDNRDADASWNDRSRMRSMIRLRIQGTNVTVVSQQHLTGLTVERNCGGGPPTCQERARPDRMSFGPATTQGGETRIPFKAAANNPCARLTELVGDIDYEGTIRINPQTRSIAIEGRVDDFPAFEAYMRVGGAAPRRVFFIAPKQGSTATDVIGYPERAVSGRVQW